MKQSQCRLWIVGGILFGTTFALILCLGAVKTVHAKSGLTPDPGIAKHSQSTFGAPPFTVTITFDSTHLTATNTLTLTQLVAVSDPVSSENLLAHFESVSSRTLDIAKWVVVILGTLAGASGVFGFKSFKDVHTLSHTIADLESQVSKLVSDVQEARKITQEARKSTMDATNRLRYLLEARDRNPEVRIRAAQKLGDSNDIGAVSILAELLETDQVADVKIEAAYGLGQLLSVGGEPETLSEGTQTLILGTRDGNDEVRREAVEALDAIIRGNVQLSRMAIQRLREIVKHDTNQGVIDAAQTALDHIEQHSESKLNVQQVAAQPVAAPDQANRAPNSK